MSRFWVGMGAVTGTAVGAVVGDAIGSRVMSNSAKGAENGMIVGILVGAFAGGAFAASVPEMTKQAGTLQGSGGLHLNSSRLFP